MGIGSGQMPKKTRPLIRRHQHKVHALQIDKACRKREQLLLEHRSRNTNPFPPFPPSSSSPLAGQLQRAVDLSILESTSLMTRMTEDGERLQKG